jgi:hypothetical protein
LHLRDPLDCWILGVILGLRVFGVGGFRASLSAAVSFAGCLKGGFGEMKRGLAGVAALVVLAAAPAWAQTDCFTTDLIAGQHYNAGTVTACPTMDPGTAQPVKLTVTYTTNEFWAITETHMAAAFELSGIPTNRKGNPQNGQFAFGGSYKPGVSTVSFDVNVTGVCEQPEQTVYIAAHAVVKGGGPGQKASSQTAWGAGTPFNSDGWQTYFTWNPGTAGCWNPG